MPLADLLSTTQKNSNNQPHNTRRGYGKQGLVNDNIAQCFGRGTPLARIKGIITGQLPKQAIRAVLQVANTVLKTVIRLALITHMRMSSILD